jgi:ornithine cyclodeaminase
VRLVDEATLRRTIGPAEALVAVERAFRAAASGALTQPPPAGLDIPAREGEVHVKSAYLHGAATFAVKVATGFYANQADHLPTGSGVILVFDAATGFPLALLEDYGYLTDLRTAAAGALATRLLAPSSVSQMAVLGSGVQARFQLRAISRVRRWESARAWSPHSEHCATYCAAMTRELGIPCLPVESAAAAVRDAELIVTTTPSRSPLFDAAAVRPDATVIAVGSDGPDKRELPIGLFGRAGKIVVDDRAQCLALGELHHAVAERAVRADAIHGTLGEVLTGARPGREGRELIICDLTGLGAQDAAIAEAAWDGVRALAAGAGSE